MFANCIEKMPTQFFFIGLLTLGGILALISTTIAFLIVALQNTEETKTFSRNGTTPSPARAVFSCTGQQITNGNTIPTTQNGQMVTAICNEGFIFADGSVESVHSCVHGSWIPRIDGCAQGYSYASQRLWNGNCNKNGKRQSPINIDTKLAIPSNLVRASFTTGIFNGEIENTGHAAEIVPDAGQTLNPNTLRFQQCPGGMAEMYRLQNCHIHWGQSEHTINGQAAYAEIHCVFQLETTGLPANRKYAVFAVLLKDQCFFPDPGVRELLGKMLASDQPTFATKGIDLAPLIINSTGNFFFYLGSLTTPPCTEAVRWIISDEIRCIGIDQYVALQKMAFENEGERDNHRTLQRLNGRMIAVATVAEAFKAVC